MTFEEATGTIFLSIEGLKNGCTNGVCKNAEESSVQFATIFFALRSVDDSI